MGFYIHVLCNQMIHFIGKCLVLCSILNLSKQPFLHSRTNVLWIPRKTSPLNEHITLHHTTPVVLLLTYLCICKRTVSPPNCFLTNFLYFPKLSIDFKMLDILFSSLSHRSSERCAKLVERNLNSAFFIDSYVKSLMAPLLQFSRDYQPLSSVLYLNMQLYIYYLR